jgi:hypothetical protein
VLLGPIISRLFTCSNEQKIKIKKNQRVLALVLSLWFYHCAASAARLSQSLILNKNIFVAIFCGSNLEINSNVFELKVELNSAAVAENGK